MRKFIAGAMTLALAACGANETVDQAQKATLPETTVERESSDDGRVDLLKFEEPVHVYSASKVYTANETEPIVKGIAVNERGKIVGTIPLEFDGVLHAPGGTLEVTTVEGFIYPGFVDGHAHLLGIGQRELMFNLEGTASIDELVTRLEAELQGREPGRPLYGRGWIETGWPEGRMPTAADLDAVSPLHPVVLERADGHAVVANNAALNRAGITKDTPNPPGGTIERDAAGKATGMLIDYAAAPVMALFKSPTDSDIEEALEVGAKLYASRGWTGVHNMSVDSKQAKMLAKLDREGKLPIRVYNALDGNSAASSLLWREDATSPKVTSRALKLYLDGALGSRGAELLAPYSDRPDTSGLSLMDQAQLKDIVGQAQANDTQLAIHAIGDKANRRLIEIAEEVPNVADLRWRIEHTQILAAEDVERMARSGLIASMQPSHAIGDLFFAPDRLGKERLIGAYAWRDILDAGGIIVGGSDAPVEVGSPLIEFYAAVARKSLDGFSNEDWHPEQAVTREEALAMFTSAAAYASFSEDTLGTLEVGKMADFTVFDRDLMSVPEADILGAKTLMTVVGGEVVFEAE